MPTVHSKRAALPMPSACSTAVLAFMAPASVLTTPSGDTRRTTKASVTYTLPSTPTAQLLGLCSTAAVPTPLAMLPVLCGAKGPPASVLTSRVPGATTRRRACSTTYSVPTPAAEGPRHRPLG
jgi:hypothetical protein